MIQKKKTPLWKKLLLLGSVPAVIFTSGQLYKTSEEVVEKPKDVEISVVQNLLGQHLSQKAKDNRDNYWENINNYKGSDRYDLTVPFHTLHLYVDGVMMGYKKVIPSDYSKILGNFRLIIEYKNKIQQRLLERRALKNKTEIGGMTDAKWHTLLRDIEVNEITLKRSLPSLFIEYATILKLRAELELKQNPDEQLVAQYVQFVHAIDNLIIENKVIIQ